MKNPTVSFIIPTYKRSPGILLRAIRSAMNQSFSVAEIIVVNDDPQGRQLIEESLSGIEKVKLLHNDENKGACFSRNRGAYESVGNYTAFLDDDDEWHPEKIEKQVARLDDGIVLVYCSGVGVAGGKETGRLSFIHELSNDPYVGLLRSNCVGGCSFPLISKDAFFRCGGFDTAFPSSQDHDLWIRLLETGTVAFVDEPLVRYSFSDDSITKDIDKRIRGYRLMLKKHKRLSRQYPNSSNHYCVDLVLLCLNSHRQVDAVKVFFYSFVFFPWNIGLAILLIRAWITHVLVKVDARKNANAR